MSAIRRLLEASGSVEVLAMRLEVSRACARRWATGKSEVSPQFEARAERLLKLGVSAPRRIEVTRRVHRISLGKTREKLRRDGRVMRSGTLISRGDRPREGTEQGIEIVRSSV